MRAAMVAVKRIDDLVWSSNPYEWIIWAIFHVVITTAAAVMS